jgi:hypothetical protein
LPIFSLIDPSKIVSSSATVNNPPVVSPLNSIVSEPVVHRPTTKRVNGRGALSTPSILDALRDESTVEDKLSVTDDSDIQYHNNNLTQAFSQQDLLEAWKGFVDKIDNAPQLKSALSMREPVLSEAWLIEYDLDTELQLDRLTLELKPKLLGYLRHQFRNDLIEIQFKVSGNTSHSSNIPYTDAERWSLLVEKYPALASLKSRFGLDFEHF